MNKKELEYINHCPAFTLCETNDFWKAVKFLNKETKERGFGLVISKPIRVHNFPDGIQYRYIISNLIKTYTGEDILIPMFEWESYLEQMLIYDRSDVDFYEENFKKIYKSL